MSTFFDHSVIAVPLAIRTFILLKRFRARLNVLIQYGDHQYIKALQLLQEDDRVSSLGLCNFDTQRMEEILSAGVKVVSNQVQVSICSLSLAFSTDQSSSL